MNDLISGFVAKGFERVYDQFAQNFADDLELGASFCAQIEGETVVELYGGFKNRDRTELFNEQTLIPIFSTTKPIAAITLATLIDRGYLNFDDNIGILWPEFLANGKNISIAQALSHQAGVPGFANEIDGELWLNPPQMAEEIAKLEPLWTPRTQSGYHPLTWGYIIGELAHRADFRTLGHILKDDICAPNNIDFHIGLDESLHHRCAEIERPRDLPQLGQITPIKRAAFLTKWAAPNRGSTIWRKIEIPSANGHGNAKSVASLYGIFANNGKIGGHEILSKDAFEQLTRPRIHNDDLVLPFNIKWAAGVMYNSNRFYGPNENSFGHSGWGGSCGFGDPAQRVSAAYVMNRQSNSLMGDKRATTLIKALYDAL